MTRAIVTRANLVVFVVLVAILLLAGGMTWERFTSAQTARYLVRHTYEVLGTINDLNLAENDAETGQLGFLLTGDDEYLPPYQAAIGRTAFLQGELQRLTADNPAQQARLRSLAPVLQRRLEGLAQTMQTRREAGFDPALRAVRTNVGREYQTQINATLSAMTAEEQTLLAQRLVEADRRSQWVVRLVIVSTTLAVLMLIWAARALNLAWSRSYKAEKEHWALALRLRTSLASLSQGVAVFGADRRLENWNECFQVLLDLPPAMVHADAPYASFHEHLTEQGCSLLESEDQVRHGAWNQGEAVVYERARPNGHQLEIRRTSMPDTGFVLTVTDMTKRAQAEGVLREAQKMQAIGQLTGGIAHDFNNLLTIILGNLEFLKRNPGDQEKLNTRIERANWAAQRGATLTRQLLAFARKQPLAPMPINLADTMPEFVPLLQRTLGEHIDVRYVETAGLWPAMADPAQLESALLNLALNARDAMPAGGRLTIELANKVLDDQYVSQHAEVTAGDYTMLAVSDTGHGMTQEVIARVFEPFFTTKPDGQGTGLGLAMVFGFVKQSGGHVKIYSEPGEGTTVRIYLPRAVGATTPSQRSSSPVDLPRGNATVLVVEDEPGVREIAVTILSDLGYRVLEAADGEEGLRVFGAHTPDIDLLLTDVVLPGKLRGRALAERITAIRPDVGVLYMSGYTENSIVHNGRLDDGVQLISKPFKREQLARKVAETLGARSIPRPGRETDQTTIVAFKQRGGA